jgi:alpha-tubulin suppressor-like RCC1 family protein
MLTDGGALVADQIASGQDFTCAHLPSSEVACWGANDFGQLGRGAGASREIAAGVLDADGGVFRGATLVGAGGEHACAFKSDGSLWCWGKNADGELGNVDAGNQSSPMRVTW